jgi:hypothetical protein
VRGKRFVSGAALQGADSSLPAIARLDFLDRSFCISTFGTLSGVTPYVAGHRGSLCHLSLA